MLGLKKLLGLQWVQSIQKHRADRDVSLIRVILALWWSVLLGSHTAIAQSRRPQPPTNPVPAELQFLLDKRPEIPHASANTPSQQGFTVPSLWWANQQFGEKLVLDWQAYTAEQAQTQQINVIVRPELWTRYTYYERYGFVLKFGSDTSNFGYQLLVLDSQDFLLGAYTCDFAQGNPNFITGLVDAQSQPIPGYGSRSRAGTLPCRLWLSPNYPRSVF